MRCSPINVPTLASIDAWILTSVLELPHPGWLNSIMVAAGRVGTGGAIWLVLAAALVLLRALTWRDLARLSIALIIVYAVVDFAVKPWVDRPRPAVISPVAGVDMPETRSFPSGHAASAIAAAFVITRVWKRFRALIWIGAGTCRLLADLPGGPLPTRRARRVCHRVCVRLVRATRPALPYRRPISTRLTSARRTLG